MSAFPERENNIGDLDQTSSGFRWEGSKTVRVSCKAVERVEDVRRKGFLPPAPAYVVVSSHQEVNFNLDTAFQIDELASIFEDLQVLDQQELQKERLLETIDFYAVNPRESFTQRMRYCFREGEFFSARSIMACSDFEEINEWGSEGEVFPIRSETVFFTRGDVTKSKKLSEGMEDIGEMSRQFFTANQFLSHLVYKKMIRANFGKDKMWDHRRAICEGSDGELVDVTRTKHILGVGSYISLNFQRYRMQTFEERIKSAKVLSLAEKIVEGSATALDCYRTFKRPEKTSYQVELECKDFPQEQRFLLEQINQILKDKGIQFSMGRGRKVLVPSK